MGELSMKSIFCIIHGITDSHLMDLNGKTPLQKANSPVLDGLANKGEILRVKGLDTLRLEDAWLSFFGGGDYKKCKKGPFQALSLGYTLTKAQKAFSCQFISSVEGIISDISETLINENEAKMLCSALNQSLKDLDCYFIHLRQAECIMIVNRQLFEENQEDEEVRELEPLQTLGLLWRDLLPKEKMNSHRLFQRIHEVLSQHEINLLKEDLNEAPVNAMLISEGGTNEDVERCLQGINLTDEKWFWYTPFASSIGIAKKIGIHPFHLKYEEKKFSFVEEIFLSLASALDQGNVIIELDYLWKSTQKGDLLEKIKTIEWLDKHFIELIKKLADKSQVQVCILPLMHSDIRKGVFSKKEFPCLVYPGKGSKIPFDEDAIDKGVDTIHLSHLRKKIQEGCPDSDTK